MHALLSRLPVAVTLKQAFITLCIKATDCDVQVSSALESIDTMDAQFHGEEPTIGLKGIPSPARQAPSSWTWGSDGDSEYRTGMWHSQARQMASAFPRRSFII